MDCGECGHANREDARFCGACGAPLVSERACHGCGEVNAAGNRFCDRCGKPLREESRATVQPAVPGHLADMIRRGGVDLAGERKHVTVLFADVMGSMDLAEQVDPEQWRSVMERFFAILCEGVHRFEGTVDKFTGDGIMALFGAPIAHEDHPLRAAYAALHLQAQVAQYADELRRTLGLSLSMRIGLNSGEVVVGGIGDDLSLEYTAVGHTVGLAQRMESLAEPGTTYMTDATAALIAGYLDTRDLGAFSVKGAREPVRVHALAGPGKARSRLDLATERGLSRFVGRSAEIAAIEAALQRALDGNAQVVGIVGEPGVGKSRLCHEFAEMAAARGLPVYRTAATATGRAVPFSTALALIRDFFEVEAHEGAPEVRERVSRRLLELDPGFGDDLPILLEFLGVGDPAEPAPRADPDARQRRLMSVVERLVQAQSRREPGLIIVEDLHWIDPGSAVLLEGLVDALPGTRSLLVTNFRPEYRAGWVQRSHYMQLPVVPLTTDASDALLDDLLGSDPSLGGLPDEIASRTGGNPFFIEEMIRSLAEQGVLQGDRGAFRLVGEVAGIRLPATVQAVLASRIDRLAPTEKALLQSAAVIGREFAEPVLADVSDLAEDELREALRGLVSSDFILQRSLYPEPVHAFRHPLTQEVAYTSQLASRRAQLHARAARALERIDPDSLDERAALIAEHWEAAHEPLQAARWSARAAGWAGSNAPAEALRWWRRVRDLADGLPEDDETRGLGVIARMWILQLGWRVGTTDEEVESAYRTGRELARRGANPAGEALIAGSYAVLHGMAGRPALDVQRQASALARTVDVPEVRLNVTLALVYFEFVAGHLDTAFAVSDELLDLIGGDAALGAGLAIGSPLAYLHMMRAHVLVMKGRLAAAREEQATGLRVAAEFGDRETEGWLHQPFIWAAWCTGVALDAVEASRRVSAIAESSGSAFSRVWALALSGTALAIGGDPATGASRLEAALSLARSQKTGLEGEPFHLAMLADARLAAGHPRDALGAARQAVAVMEARGISGPGAGACSALARALCACGDLPAAEAALDEAFEHARRTGARAYLPRLWELRAGLATARGDAAAEARAAEEARRHQVALGLAPVL